MSVSGTASVVVDPAKSPVKQRISVFHKMAEGAFPVILRKSEK